MDASDQVKLSIRGLFLILLLVLPAPVAEAFSGAGSGTEASPYVITDVNELQEMNDPNYLNKPDVYFILGNNIDASATSGWNGGEGFVSIAPFQGHFDGRGHKINDLYMNYSTCNVGLFSCRYSG